MASRGLIDFNQKTDFNSLLIGRESAVPFLYAGNWENAGETHFGESSPEKDETPMATLDFSDPGTAKQVNVYNEPGQCLKRINFEVNKVPCSAGVLSAGSDESRGLEQSEWGLDADERTYQNFLFNLDTMHLFEGGSLDNYGRVGSSDEYDSGPFPARGLPVKLQKVYFYGTRGQISGSEEVSSETIFNNRRCSDGRGALFSTYILCASTAVNVLDRDGGNEENGYNPSELDKWEMDGGSFDYLEGGQKKGSYDFHLNEKDQYKEGIDFEWGQDNETTDSPLIIGDGALGFRELRIGEGIFGKVDTYIVDEASAYYEQEITLCIDGDNVTGTVLFKPNVPNASLFNDSNKKMIVHNIVNTFSCTGIVPTGDCDGESACQYEGGNTPLPFQYEKVQILDKTSMLLRTEAAIARDEPDSSNKCEEA